MRKSKPHGAALGTHAISKPGHAPSSVMFDTPQSTMPSASFRSDTAAKTDARFTSDSGRSN